MYETEMLGSCFLVESTVKGIVQWDTVEEFFIPIRFRMLVIRRSKLHYTASGIITRIGGRLVHEKVIVQWDTMEEFFVPVRFRMLIIRRSKLHYTASGIITHIGGRLVHEKVIVQWDTMEEFFVLYLLDFGWRDH